MAAVAATPFREDICHSGCSPATELDQEVLDRQLSRRG